MLLNYAALIIVFWSFSLFSKNPELSSANAILYVSSALESVPLFSDNNNDISLIKEKIWTKALFKSYETILAKTEWHFPVNLSFIGDRNASKLQCVGCLLAQPNKPITDIARC